MNAKKQILEKRQLQLSRDLKSKNGAMLEEIESDDDDDDDNDDSDDNDDYSDNDGNTEDDDDDNEHDDNENNEDQNDKNKKCIDKQPEKRKKKQATSHEWKLGDVERLMALDRAIKQQKDEDGRQLSVNKRVAFEKAMYGGDPIKFNLFDTFYIVASVQINQVEDANGIEVTRLLRLENRLRVAHAVPTILRQECSNMGRRDITL